KDCRSYGFHTLSVSVADFMATSEEMAENVNEYLNFILYLVSFYRERLKDLKPLLSGEEIMEIKGFKRPNEWIGKIKEKMLELQAVGKIRTKEEAISFVKGFTVKEEG
ncbi:MAG: polynucleotide adenylyltransferase, partial [Desulfurobacteriaceae bacterium]